MHRMRKMNRHPWRLVGLAAVAILLIPTTTAAGVKTCDAPLTAAVSASMSQPVSTLVPAVMESSVRAAAPDPVDGSTASGVVLAASGGGEGHLFPSPRFEQMIRCAGESSNGWQARRNLHYGWCMEGTNCCQGTGTCNTFCTSHCDYEARERANQDSALAYYWCMDREPSAWCGPGNHNPWC